MTHTALRTRLAAIVAGSLALSACSGDGGGVLRGLDIDLRGSAGQLDTSDAAANATSAAPQPDARGIISYPGYQVAVARRGDTVKTVATRIGIPSEELARQNTLPDTVTLREGEILLLPRRVAEPSAASGGSFDVASIGTAIDRADGGSPGLPVGAEPTRHRVAPGETAFSIARTYGVPVASLAEWNGLGPDLGVRVGQYLLIPTAAPQPAGGGSDGSIEVAAVAPPGGTSATPLPPSASQPLPAETPKPAAAPAPKAEPLQDRQTAASDTSKLRMPVQGRIIRAFEKGKNEGIGIAADAGTPVVAADGGTVAAITRDTDQVPILVIRHSGNLLTVYAGVDNIAVQKGDQVTRGEQIAVVRAANPSFVHFEVREGFDSVDPSPYLN